MSRHEAAESGIAGGEITTSISFANGAKKSTKLRYSFLTYASRSSTGAALPRIRRLIISTNTENPMAK